MTLTLKNKEKSNIFAQASACTLCSADLPFAPKPVFQASAQAEIVIIGQAPGIKAHESQIPWNDASGDRLRAWLDVSKTTFYDPNRIALVPVGFYYPGKGKSGDLPPMKICAPTWHHDMLACMQVKVTLLVGQYAQNYYLRDKFGLTERVKNWQAYLPKFFVLPHPSPRNNIWLKRHSWFEKDVIPSMRKKLRQFLSAK